MNRPWRIVVFFLSVAILIRPSAAVGQADLAAVRSNPSLHPSFVHNSLYLVEQGADRQGVLETLSFVAKTEASGPFVGLAAVRAMFHIASDNQTIQRYLLDIIEDPNACRRGVTAALRLLVYVADESGRAQLRNMATMSFPCNRSWDALRVLVELGDAQTLQLLTGLVANLSSELQPVRPVLESMARKIQLQEDSSRLIARLASNEDDVGWAWLVRQAMRHGAAAEQVRAAVVSCLGSVTGASHPLQHGSLIRTCDEYSLFTEEDCNSLACIRAVRRFHNLVADEGTGPAWATLAEARRAAFYSIPHTPVAVPSTPVPVPTTQPASPPEPQPWAPNQANYQPFMEWMATVNWQTIDPLEGMRLFKQKMCELDLLPPAECETVGGGSP